MFDLYKSARRREVYFGAIEKWGEPAQIVMAIEELSELTHVLCKILNGKRSKNCDELYDELADASIMLEQLQYMLVSDSRFRDLVKEKIDKLGEAVNLKEASESSDKYSAWLANPDWKHTWITGRLHFGGAKKGAFMYNVLFYRHPTLVLPHKLDASMFNDGGRGRAKT